MTKIKEKISNKGHMLKQDFRRLRPRRCDADLRNYYSETPALHAHNFILPLFVCETTRAGAQRREIPGLSHVYHLNIPALLEEVEAAWSLGLHKFLLFGVVDEFQKDSCGSVAQSDEALVPRAIRALRALEKDLEKNCTGSVGLHLISDICLCSYTDHGHCGVLRPQLYRESPPGYQESLAREADISQVDQVTQVSQLKQVTQEVANDETLAHYLAMGLAHARAGVNAVAPSGMMDGQVVILRQGLDTAGFLDCQVLAYSAKYASSFYGPFRKAVGSAPSEGGDRQNPELQHRKSYQMDFRNSAEALEEVQADLDEGAAQVMVKPALCYLDIVQQVAQLLDRQDRRADLVAYHVSGEYMMWRSAVTAGVLDEWPSLHETYTAMQRAGAAQIVSYAAPFYLQHLPTERVEGSKQNPESSEAQNTQPGQSKLLFAQAQNYFPGGVNSPVRSFASIGGTPRFAHSGSGPLLRDADGHDYIDLCCSWGALPLGHADVRVQQALAKQLQLGFSFGMPTENENILAEGLQKLLPQLEQLRLVSSGTEACMSALRLARACTGRKRILKFTGCYHGHADYLLVQAGSGAALSSGELTSSPSSTGVPQEFAELCLSVPYNDLAAVEVALAGGDIAGVIVEPVAANMGLVLPHPHFLPGLRQACDRYGSLLIFDEVISGLRLPNDATDPKKQAGSAAAYFSIQPDLSCFGKAIAGGLPLAAYGGHRKLMRQLAPEGNCYQAGTLSGNPLATAAAISTLEALWEDWPRAYDPWQDFAAELHQLAARHGAAVSHCGSLLAVYPGALKILGRAPQNYAESRELARQEYFAKMFHFLLERDIYLSPSPYETLFLSTSHDFASLDFVLQQFADYFRQS